MGKLTIFFVVFLLILTSCVEQSSVTETSAPTITISLTETSQATQTPDLGLLGAMLEQEDEDLYRRVWTIGPYDISATIGNMEIKSEAYAFSRFQVSTNQTVVYDKTVVAQTWSLSFGMPVVLGLSEDGEQLFLADTVSGEGCFTGRSYTNLRTLDTVYWFEVPLADKFVGSLAISPDGQSIAYVDNNKDQIQLLSLLPNALDMFYWHGPSPTSASFPFPKGQPIGSRVAFAAWAPDSNAFAVTAISEPCYSTTTNVIRVLRTPDLDLIKDCTIPEIVIEDVFWSEEGYFIESNGQTLQVDLDGCTISE